MKALVEMNNMLKAKLEQQTKVYQQSLQEMQNEIDNLQRNCDVFNEQMNDAVEVTVKLKQDKRELREWLEDEIKNCNPNPQLYFNAQDEIKRHLYGMLVYVEDKKAVYKVTEV